jgi:hypothetical protein
MIRSKLSVLALSFLALTSLTDTSQSAFAASSDKPTGNGGNLGLGVMLGDPTGVDLKYWLERDRALHFGLAYAFDNYGELLGDYLFEFPHAFNGKEGAQFIPYVGIGGALFFGSADKGHDFHGYNDSVALGVRIPLGIEFIPHGTPIGLTAEIAPGIGLIPGTFGFVQGYVGARFYF